MYRFEYPQISADRTDGVVPASVSHGRLACVKSSCSPRADLAAGTALFDLLTFLEIEPAVVSYVRLPDDLVDVRYWGGRILVGTLPASGPERLRMEILKCERERGGRRVLLVPEARLRRPFHDNRRLIAASASVTLSAGERLRILDAVDETGAAELGDLVRMFGAPDADAGDLAGTGILRIDLGRPLGADSTLNRFTPDG